MISPKVAEFGSKLATYCCILGGVSIAIGPVPNDLLTVALILSGAACSIAGCWWLVKLRRKYG